MTKENESKDDSDQETQQMLYRQRLIYKEKARQASRDESPELARHYLERRRQIRQKAISENRGSW